jgi:hypothetical protein
LVGNYWQLWIICCCPYMVVEYNWTAYVPYSSMQNMHLKDRGLVFCVGFNKNNNIPKQYYTAPSCRKEGADNITNRHHLYLYHIWRYANVDFVSCVGFNNDNNNIPRQYYTSPSYRLIVVSCVGFNNNIPRQYYTSPSYR